MNDLISRQSLCEYALNQKDKSVTPNDIMRFPPAQPETCVYWDRESNFCALHRPSAELEWHEWHDCDPTDKSTLPEPGSWAIWSDKEGHRIIARWKEDAIDPFWPDQRMFDFNLEDAVAWTEIPKRTKGTNDIDALKELPPAQPEPRWIPVEERMPEEFGNYLITEMPIGDFEIEPYVATYSPEDNEWTTGFPIKIVRRPVIAWMPLPRSYSERRQK